MNTEFVIMLSEKPGVFGINYYDEDGFHWIEISCELACLLWALESKGV